MRMTANIFADRAGRLKGEAAFEILAKTKELEAQGKNIIHFEIILLYL